MNQSELLLFAPPLPCSLQDIFHSPKILCSIQNSPSSSTHANKSKTGARTYIGLARFLGKLAIAGGRRTNLSILARDGVDVLGSFLFAEGDPREKRSDQYV
jgi:hypothetical protein